MRKVSTKAVSTILILTMAMASGCSLGGDAPQVTDAAKNYSKALLHLNTRNLKRFTEEGLDIFEGLEPEMKYRTTQRYLLGATVLDKSEYEVAEPVKAADGSYQTKVTFSLPYYGGAEDYPDAIKTLNHAEATEKTSLDLNLIIDDGKWVVDQDTAREAGAFLDKIFDDVGTFLKDSRYNKAGRLVDEMMTSIASGDIDKLYMITSYDPWIDTDIFSAQSELYYNDQWVEDNDGAPHDAQLEFIKAFFSNTTYTYEVNEAGEEVLVSVKAKVPDSRLIASKVLDSRDMNIAGIASVIASLIDYEDENNLFTGHARDISNDYTYEAICKEATKVCATVEKRTVNVDFTIPVDSGRLVPDKNRGEFLQKRQVNLIYDVIYNSSDTFDSELKEAVEIFVKKGLIDRDRADKITKTYYDEAVLWAYGQSLQDKGNN